LFLVNVSAFLYNTEPSRNHLKYIYKMLK